MHARPPSLSLTRHSIAVAFIMLLSLLVLYVGAQLAFQSTIGATGVSRTLSTTSGLSPSADYSGGRHGSQQ
ncbi:MAG: hypothetical protein HY329_11730 [Chloroflexi bacterium]|nr:hypothetical protein [Chloroflexota bacterium]